LIGAQGQIFFRLYLIYINRDTLLEFNKHYGNLFSHKHLKIFPESFKTISFLKRKLERDSFLLLYIKESYCKVVAIEDGFYKRIEHINFGINFLMQMYKDNQIVKYRYKTSEEIDAIGCDERGNISFYKKGSRGMYIQCIIKVEKSADSNFLVPNWYTSEKERDVARIKTIITEKTKTVK